MVSNRLVYDFCKRFVDGYERAGEEVDSYELAEMDMTLDEYLESVCVMEKAGLQALIVDDFVQMLNPKLQEEIIMQCMDMKMGKNFDRYSKL